MKIKSNLFRNVFVFLVIFLFSSSSVYAVCPVCTVAVGAGLGISRLIGIDDTVAGLWVGGLILSSSFWMADFIKKKEWKVPYPTIFSTILFYLFIVVPLYFSGLIGIEGNNLWGIDKLLLGIVLGSIIFLFGVFADKFLRNTNDGKVYIYYQKVILPVLFLTIASYIFYLITI